MKPRVNSHFSDPCPPPTRWFPAAAWNEIIFRPRCTSSRYLKHFIRINECECGNVRSEIFDNFFPLFFLFCNGGFFMIRSMWIWWWYVVFFILDWYLIINLKKKNWFIGDWFQRIIFFRRKNVKLETKELTLSFNSIYLDIYFTKFWLKPFAIFSVIATLNQYK